MQVRDEQGRKMSKTLGNVVDPLDVIHKYGTDALRFTLATGGQANHLHTAFLLQWCQNQHDWCATHMHWTDRQTTDTRQTDRECCHATHSLPAAAINILLARSSPPLLLPPTFRTPSPQLGLVLAPPHPILLTLPLLPSPPFASSCSPIS